MKRLKVFALLVACMLITLAFAACGNDATVELDDYDYTVKYDDYFRSYTIDCDLTLRVDTVGSYAVEYDIVLLDHGVAEIKTTHREKNFKVSRSDADEGTYTLNDYFSIYDVYNSNGKTIRIENFVAVGNDADVEDETAYYGYAIGFGILSLLILAGAVVCFVIVRKR